MRIDVSSFALGIFLVLIVGAVGVAVGRATVPVPPKPTILDLPSTPFPVRESVITDAKKGTYGAVQYNGAFQNGMLVLDRARMQLVKQ